MRKEFIIGGEKYVFDDVIDAVTNSALEDIPTIVFLNKIQSFVNKFDFNISVFGSGDEEHGITHECKVVQGFNTTIYEAPETSSRTDGILDCYEWLVNNQKIDNLSNKN